MTNLYDRWNEIYYFKGNLITFDLPLLHHYFLTWFAIFLSLWNKINIGPNPSPTAHLLYNGPLRPVALSLSPPPPVPLPPRPGDGAHTAIPTSSLLPSLVAVLLISYLPCAKLDWERAGNISGLGLISSLVGGLVNKPRLLPVRRSWFCSQSGESKYFFFLPVRSVADFLAAGEGRWSNSSARGSTTVGTYHRTFDIKVWFSLFPNNTSPKPRAKIVFAKG